MNTLLLLAAALLQVQATFPLQGLTPDDDLPWRRQFTPNGQGLVILHPREHVIASLTYLDVATNTVTARSADLGDVNSFALSPDGRLAAVPDERGHLHVLTLPTLQPVGSVPLSMTSLDSYGVTIDSTGSRAVVQLSLGNVVWVVDLNQLVEERRFFLNSSYYGLDVLLGADDRSLLLQDPREVNTVDIFTGLETARAQLSIPGTVVARSLSGDRATLVIVTRSGSAPNQRLHVERFAIPGLASLGAGPVLGAPIELADGVYGPQRIDRTGRTLVLAATTGPVVLDTVSRAARQVRGGAQGLIVSEDGSHILTEQDSVLIVTDVASGVEVVRSPAVGTEGRPNWSTAAASAGHFAVSRWPSERTELFDVSGPSPTRVGDFSTGFGEEADGPYTLQSFDAGQGLAALARDSDAVFRTWVYEGASTTGRLATDRQPLGIAPLSGGRAVVVHGRGQSLLRVSLVWLNEQARFALPLPGIAVHADPLGSTAWVELMGTSERALLHMDTWNGAVLARVELPPGSGLSPHGRRLHAATAFDLARGRAFVATPETGEVAWIDLSLAVVVDVQPVLAGIEQPILVLSKDGSRLFHHAGGGTVTAFDVGPVALQRRWDRTCSTTSAFPLRADPQLALMDGDRVLFVPTTGFSSCPDASLLDTATGLESGTAPGLREPSWVVAFNDEVWLGQAHPGGNGGGRFRLTGGSLTSLGGSPDLTGSLVRPAIDDVGQWTAVMGAAPSGSNSADVIQLVDLVNDTSSCSQQIPNSLGQRATLRADGRGAAGAPLTFTLEGTLPTSMPSILAVSAAMAPPLTVGLGRLCLGGSVGRITQQVSGSGSLQRFRIDALDLPIPAGLNVVLPGSSWSFQAWYRDTTPGGVATSNTSNALTVLFL